MNILITQYKQLVNHTLPYTYSFPVRYNHCFNRIILDWLFMDCWYNHLDKDRTAFTQLSKLQLQLAVDRMNLWLQDQQVLVNDNNASLSYRKEHKRLHSK